MRGVALPVELAGRARAQNLRSRGLPWSPKKIISFGELVWLASIGPQFVCQQNSQAELAHRTCTPVVFCVPPKIFRQTCLVGLSWPPICLPAELAGRARTQNLRSGGLLCSQTNSFGKLVWLASVGPQCVYGHNSHIELAHIIHTQNSLT